MKNFSEYNSIFFVGIGGISMSALAKLMLFNNKKVFGCDANLTNITQELCSLGASISEEHNCKGLLHCDLLCFSGAINNLDVHIQLAKKLGIECVERSVFLGEVSKDYSHVIAIAGSHGKTTTTAMLGYIFIIAGKQPSVHVGGQFTQLGGNIHIGQKDYFITEACEFRDSFLSLHPEVAVVTNIEREHLDYFKNYESEKKSFERFCNQSFNLVINGHYSDLVCCNSLVKVQTFSKGDYVAKNITQKDGKYSFDAYKNSDFIGHFDLGIVGEYNVSNALAVICVCNYYGLDYQDIYQGLSTFQNGSRRMEVVGSYSGNLIVSDYAHHPTEICATLKACKQAFSRKIICIFQPHTYSRTQSLFNEFLSCFNGVEELYLLPTYPAREKYNYLGSSARLGKELKDNKNFVFCGVVDNKNLISKIKNLKYKNVLILFLGAGDIDQLPRLLALEK